MSKQVLVPIADGTEEIEAVCIIDTLRRAQAEVTVASVDQLQVTASRGTKIVADKIITDCVGQTFDCIALPGGMPGAEHLRDSADLTQMLKSQGAAGGLFGAICASPAVVLHHHGLLDQKRATCYPSFLSTMNKALAVNEPVVVDENCITSQGPATAIAFTLVLVDKLFGEEKAKKVGSGMLVKV